MEDHGEILLLVEAHDFFSALDIWDPGMFNPMRKVNLLLTGKNL